MFSNYVWDIFLQHVEKAVTLQTSRKHFPLSYFATFRNFQAFGDKLFIDHLWKRSNSWYSRKICAYAFNYKNKRTMIHETETTGQIVSNTEKTKCRHKLCEARDRVAQEALDNVSERSRYHQCSSQHQTPKPTPQRCPRADPPASSAKQVSKYCKMGVTIWRRNLASVWACSSVNDLLTAGMLEKTSAKTFSLRKGNSFSSYYFIKPLSFSVYQTRHF